MTEAGSRPDSRAVTVATYDDYLSAQKAVDFLSDNKFPVNLVSIVGEDVSTVERVVGRITVARAAGLGALSGAWLGLLIGLLLGIFADSNWLGVLLGATAIGAVWGAIFGAIAHAMTGGRRDFRSISGLVAARYHVNVAAEQADVARRLLTQLSPG